MDHIDNILVKYKKHPSIVKIKEKVIINNKFDFIDMTPDEIEKEIKQLDPKKACVENDLPPKILIGSNDSKQILAKDKNTSKNGQTYPLLLKVAFIMQKKGFC